MRLPSEASIGRYVRQWSDLRRRPRPRAKRERPQQPHAVHQRWQIDFKTDIALENDTPVHIHTVRDPVGEACIEGCVYATEQVQSRNARVPLEHVRITLRKAFAQWSVLPQEIQTDGEPTLVTHPRDAFPSDFTLWLAGLGIQHLVIRSGKPTDNAEVERCHRTITDYVIVGNKARSVEELQAALDEAVRELNFELPSRAEGCAGRTPVEAHPELLHPTRPFRPEHELAHFDLGRVDAFLSTFTWTRKVGKTGQICIGGHHQYYSVGKAYARQQVQVRFDPADRHFVFGLPISDEGDEFQEIGRRPARNLEIEDIVGLAAPTAYMLPQQLPLPHIFVEG
jgi:hypothetical protein